MSISSQDRSYVLLRPDSGCDTVKPPAICGLRVRGHGEVSWQDQLSEGASLRLLDFGWPGRTSVGPWFEPRELFVLRHAAMRARSVKGDNMLSRQAESDATSTPTAVRRRILAPVATAFGQIRVRKTLALGVVLALGGLSASTGLGAPMSGASSSPVADADSSESSSSPASSSPSLAGGYIVAFRAGVSSDEQAAALADVGAVEISAIPALRMHAVTLPDEAAEASLGADARVDRVEADATRAAQGQPNDTQYEEQWSLPRIGWDQVYGDVEPAGSATVAILDTGINGSHPDLAGKIVAGADVVDGQGDATSDPNGHGTAMAGIVAAATNNGDGIAGVGYAGVDVMPVRVLGADGTGQDSDIIEGVVYAADHGADVILMAFSNPGYSASLQQAIDYAWARGAVIVAAVGNGSSADPTYPAGDRGVMGVSSTDMTDALSWTSNYGPAAFIAAPGEGIATTAAGGGYSSMSGTSAAAAIVAGAAGLIKASSFTASNGVIVSRLARNADPAGSVDQTGNRRVNLARAIFDSSTDEIQPAGAAPVGDGGPLVGPYDVATVSSVAVTFPANNGVYNTTSYTANGGDVHGTVQWSSNSTDNGRGVAVSIKRNSDNLYWTGSGFSNASEVFNAATCSSCTGNGGKTWSYAFALPADGSYTVTARATQLNQPSLDSTPNTFTVDNTAPGAPTVTSPANAVTVNTSPFSVTGTAEANSLVRIWTDANNNGVKDAGETTLRGSQQLSGGATSYSISATLTSNAANDLVVTATDAAGNESAAADVPRITHDNTAPAAPSAPDLDAASDSGSSSTDNITNDDTPTFNGTAEANSTVELFRGGTVSLGTTTANGSGQWTRTVAALVDGTYSITARATDAAGNTSAASSALSITIDTTAPTVSSINRAAGASQATNAASVQWTVTFGESVVGVDASDFDLVGGGV